MSKYADFDTKLLGLIRDGIDTFAELASLMFGDAEPFCQSPRGLCLTKPWRIVDRRLQALRKAGRIVYAGGRWRLLEVENV